MGSDATIESLPVTTDADAAELDAVPRRRKRDRTEYMAVAE
jgi:hypothetical protein